MSTPSAVVSRRLGSQIHPLTPYYLLSSHLYSTTTTKNTGQKCNTPRAGTRERETPTPPTPPALAMGPPGSASLRPPPDSIAAPGGFPARSQKEPQVVGHPQGKCPVLGIQWRWRSSETAPGTGSHSPHGGLVARVGGAGGRGEGRAGLGWQGIARMLRNCKIGMGAEERGAIYLMLA